MSGKLAEAAVLRHEDSDAGAGLILNLNVGINRQIVSRLGAGVVDAYLNAARAAKLNPEVTMSTLPPMGPMRRPNPSGASAWQIRDGASISPSRCA